MKKPFYIVIADNTKPIPYIKLIENIFSENEVTVLSFEEIVKKDKSDKQRTIPDLILFTGGEDVYPSNYGQSVGKNTHYNASRDKLEASVFSYFRFNYKIPKLGICRGAQFLTVMNEGTLIQDVTGHTKPHLISDIDFGEYEVSSTHHQMMYPFVLHSKSYKILAFSTYFQSNIYLNGENQPFGLIPDFVEPEIVFYPRTNCLAMQPHPEIMNPESTERKYLEQHIKNLVNNKILKNNE